MGVIQISVPEELNSLIQRQVAAGRANSEADFLIEAAWKYLESEALEYDLARAAEAGIADAEAGQYTTIATAADGEAWLEQKMAKLRGRTATDKLVADR